MRAYHGISPQHADDIGQRAEMFYMHMTSENLAMVYRGIWEAMACVDDDEAMYWRRYYHNCLGMLSEESIQKMMKDETYNQQGKIQRLSP